MEIGGKLNEVKPGYCSREKDPPVSLREPSPLFHRGDTAESYSNADASGRGP